MNQELHDRLILLARRRSLTTYSEIAGHFGLNMDNDAQRDQFTEMLIEVARHEQDLNNPVLTSLVVHAGDNNNPGEGYYALAREFGLFNGSRNNLERITFWSNQVADVYHHWPTR